MIQDTGDTSSFISQSASGTNSYGSYQLEKSDKDFFAILFAGALSDPLLMGRLACVEITESDA
jgi:hypothetical protein